MSYRKSGGRSKGYQTSTDGTRRHQKRRELQEYQGDDDSIAPAEKLSCYLCAGEVHFRPTCLHQGIT